MKIWGKPGHGFLDRWSFVHLAFWFVIGANMASQHVAPLWFWGITGGGAYLWEIIEMTLEKYTSLVVVHESRLNRWVSDPAMAVIGVSIGWVILG